MLACIAYTTVLILAFLVDWEVQGVHARQAHTENGGHVRQSCNITCRLVPIIDFQTKTSEKKIAHCLLKHIVQCEM